MNTVLNFVLKYSGAGKVWSIIDGYKLYGTSTLAILGALLGLATQIAPLLAAHDTIGLYTLITHISSDPNWIALLAGFAGIAAAHKSDKNAAAKIEAAEVVAAAIPPAQ